MTSKKWWGLIGAVAVAAGTWQASWAGGPAAVEAGAAAQRAALRIGAIDIGRAMKDHRASREEEQALNQWRTGQQVELDAASDRVEGLQAELEEYSRGSEDYKARAQELAVSELRLKMRLDILNEELESKRAKALRDSYARVRFASDALREKLGIELVLQYNPFVLSGRTQEEVAKEIVPRSVLCFSEQLDITERVITILDS